MIGVVGEDTVTEYVEKGYLVVETTTGAYLGEKYERVWLAHPDRTCLHPMRGWNADHRKQMGFCTMDAGHRGRHSTVTFFCDGCGLTRRGQPYRTDNEAGVQFCWMCTGMPWVKR